MAGRWELHWTSNRKEPRRKPSLVVDVDSEPHHLLTTCVNSAKSTPNNSLVQLHTWLLMLPIKSGKYATVRLSESNGKPEKKTAKPRNELLQVIHILKKSLMQPSLICLIHLPRRVSVHAWAGYEEKLVERKMESLMSVTLHILVATQYRSSTHHRS